MESRTENSDRSFRWEWLRNLIKEEKGTQLRTDAMLIALRELILGCQKRGIERVLQRDRIRLKNWMYFALGVAILRLICMIALLYILCVLRYYHFTHVITLSSITANFIYRIIYQGLTLYISLAISGILMEIFLMLTFHSQRSSFIAFSYALNFVVVTLLITMGPFAGSTFILTMLTLTIRQEEHRTGRKENRSKQYLLLDAGFHNYAHQLTTDLYGFAIRKNPVPFELIEMLHRKYKCCGFISTEDWSSKYIYKFRALFTNRTIALINDFAWISYCFKISRRTPSSVPHFCCEVEKCDVPHQVSFALTELNKPRTPVEAYQFYREHLYVPNIKGVYQKACFTAISDTLDTLTTATTKWLVALGLLTIIMTVLIAVILLYNSGQGELLPHLNRVRSPHADSLIWLFKKMDGQKESVDEDLSDYSFIQEMKDFNVDKDLTASCSLFF
ncbi:hypothetical protein Angca_000301, partial [Angiostrongylus cantonensis]